MNLSDKIEGYVSQGTGWVISKINKHIININHYVPLEGSSYMRT